MTVLLWTTLPLWLLAGYVLSPFVPGWLRPVRLLWLGVVHLTLESLILVELFGLWIASGFGLFIRNPFFERIHYDLVQSYLVVFFREAQARAAPEDRDRRARPRTRIPGEPLLVFCRHAGPGDSFTLMYALMHWYGREPRVVLKEMLAWDPALGRPAHPPAEPVHLGPPARAAATSRPRSASWRATSTRTTRS